MIRNKSLAYSIRERETKKRGIVYDVIFRIVDENGREHQKVLSGYATKKLAKAAYLDFMRTYVIPDINPLKERLIVGDLVSAYFNSINNQIKDSTIYEKQKVFDLFILPAFRNQDLSSITKERLYQWQDELWAQRNPKTGEYYSYKYLSKIRTYFSAFLTWCSQRYSFINPMTGVLKPKRRTKQAEMEIWTREEFDRFLSVIADNKWRVFFSFLYFTGLRKGEALALTPSDVESGCVHVNKSLTRKTLNGEAYAITSTKNEKERVVPFPEILKEIMKDYVPGSGFFFGTDKPLTDTTICRVMHQYAEAAELHKIRVHDLRHSYVSMLVHLGGTIPVVASLIGDTQQQVIKTYSHLWSDDKIEIIKKIL